MLNCVSGWRGLRLSSPYDSHLFYTWAASCSTNKMRDVGWKSELIVAHDLEYRLDTRTHANNGRGHWPHLLPSFTRLQFWFFQSCTTEAIKTAHVVSMQFPMKSNKLNMKHSFARSRHQVVGIPIVLMDFCGKSWMWYGLPYNIPLPLLLLHHFFAREVEFRVAIIESEISLTPSTQLWWAMIIVILNLRNHVCRK